MEAVDSLSEDVVSESVFKGENPGLRIPARKRSQEAEQQESTFAGGVHGGEFTLCNQVTISRVALGRLKDADADADTGTATTEAGR